MRFHQQVLVEVPEGRESFHVQSEVCSHVPNSAAYIHEGVVVLVTTAPTPGDFLDRLGLNHQVVP